MAEHKPNEVLPVDATPHKRFFIDMITRDISLEACVLDLIDNSVDGATRSTDDAQGKKARSPKPHPLSSGGSRYKKFKIDVTFTPTKFQIRDNCGGIPVDIACKYAFNFGRDPTKHTDADTESGIGIYGIGMKRGLFKLGRNFAIRSDAQDDAFDMDIDVPTWAAKPPSDWNMELTTAKPVGRAGTTIKVTNLLPGVTQEFGTTSFETRLASSAGRTYAAFLDQGLKLTVNGKTIKPTPFTFLHKHGFQPLHEQDRERVTRPTKAYVDLEIWAGAASATNDRPGGDDDEDASMWGWYVLCNNRVVLAADKTERTGWGLNKFQQWHPQYNGFVGIVSFRSEEPYALPWTTTKNDIDMDSAVYRTARTKMQEAARSYIAYSRARRANLDTAKKLEATAKPIRATKIKNPQPMKLPKVPEAVGGQVNILYQRPKRQVQKAAAALGNPEMSAAQVGGKTFDYFYSSRVE